MLMPAEDSLLMNQSSIDRGMFRSTTMKTSREEARGNTNEEFGLKPGDRIVGKHQNGYDKVDVDGFAPPGTRVAEGDVVVLKTAPGSRADKADRVGPSKGRSRRDMSTVIKKGDEGVVDAICKTVDETTNILIKLRTRSSRVPQVGDKFASCVSVRRGL